MIRLYNLEDGEHLAARFGGPRWQQLQNVIKGLSNRTYVGKEHTKHPYWRIPMNVVEDLQEEIAQLEAWQREFGLGPPDGRAQGIGLAMSAHAQASYDAWAATVGRRLRTQEVLEKPLGIDEYFKAERFPLYQQIGARYLWLNRRVICGDWTGTGKTMQSIAATAIGFTRNTYAKAIIICEPALDQKMAAEVAKFVSWRAHVIKRGDPPKRRLRTYQEFAADPDPCYLVLPYSTCRSGIIRRTVEVANDATGEVKKRKLVDTAGAEMRVLLGLLEGTKFATVIDEVQNCKHWTSLQTRGVALVADKSEHCYGLSATYIEGRIEEGHAVFRVVRPRTFGALKQFTDRHVTNKQERNILKRYRLIHEVRRKITPYVIRRNPDDIDDEGVLPKIHFVERFIVITENQRALYRKVLDEEKRKREEMIELRGGEPSAGDGLWRMNRERIACLFPELIDPEVKESPKFDELLRVIGDTEEGSKVVVFSYFQKVVETLIERLDEYWPTIGFHGGMKLDREAIKRAFREDPEVKVLVTSDVWQRGQDFDSARHLVNFDLLWNPAWMFIQRAGRVRRFTSAYKQVVVWSLVTERTVEDYMWHEILEPKKMIMDAVQDGGEESMSVTREIMREIVRDYRG